MPYYTKPVETYGEIHMYPVQTDPLIEPKCTEPYYTKEALPS